LQEVRSQGEFLPAMPTCWNEATKPHKFCPGCGHGLILKTIGELIDELEIRDRVVFGCDVGCSLLAWDFFACDSLQTHHGRVTPTMVGFKRANPDAICIAYMGDGGGYAIGSQHLFNASVRNDRITVVLCNNTNYGMTGGQMAPTTLPGQKTETTPYGRDVHVTGYPTKGPEMVATVTPEGAYVARGSMHNLRQLKSFIRKAIETQISGSGFGFVEALSSCPTNWRTNAKKTWEFVEKDMTAYFDVGEIKAPQAKEGV